MPTYNLENSYYGSKNNPATFKGAKSKRPVELVVYPDGTTKYEYVSSEVKPNRGEQLDKANKREVEKVKADEKVHKQFDSKSWRDFLLTQAAGAAAAGAGAIAMPYIGNGILAGGDKAAGYLLSKAAANPTATALAKAGLKSYFGVEGLRNYFSDNGWAKTVREWNTYNNKFGAIKSGLGDIIDLSMMFPSLNDSKYLTTNINKVSLKDILRYIDSGGIPKSELLNDTPNSLRRFIGAGNAGYIDALETGIIRGNVRPSLTGSTRDTKRIGNYLRNHGYRISDIRKLMSQNLDRDSFNRLKKGIQTYYGVPSELQDIGGVIHKDISTVRNYEDYIKLLNKSQEEKNIEVFVRNSRKIKGYEWLKNWGENPQATFALHGEALPNDLLFPGDFAIKIQNADKYAKEATELGHFANHPTTYKPIEITNPDVEFYVRKDGLFGKKYMKRIPQKQVLEDTKRIKEGKEPKTKPRINKIFNK